ncbi:hypothetical protein [Streptomyces colonosanans]|uniref:Ricin B lectin domain-containing protein n=1 Tax=Streptomyces colonosanans TaxID=1428652 RepID=A0A1S2P8W0_9ACTN|nr:hypothetical protein [Streptomyces colonosanans]OIJ89982.1 hypothetical protein BIV24_18705 [Streptomyces colonosanans]
MKHRGRHRRRRRGRALRATLAGTALALTAAATLISTSQAVGGNDPGGLTRITAADRTAQFRLHENLTDRRTLDTLTRSLGGGVGIHDVLASADHTMRDRSACDGTETDALPVRPAATRAYCWNHDDATTTQWLPRSVATSADTADGRPGADRVILSGWTHDDRRAGDPAADRGLARIAFIDANDPARLAYRWVLLVAPSPDGKDFTAVRTRMSGMVRHQDKLIVTARDSLLVFDLRRILRTNVDSAAVGRVKGGYAAHGYRYVLPAIGSYRPAQGPCSRTGAHAVPCFSALSLDRTSAPVSLVAGERLRRGTTDRAARVWRYAYSTAPGRAGLLATDARGDVRTTEAYETEASGVRGVLSYRRTPAGQADWYIDRAPSDGGRHGTLWRQNTSGAKAATCAADETYACWGRHTASLSYQQETGELWTLTEGEASGDEGRSGTAGGRVLYAVPLDCVDAALE